MTQPLKGTCPDIPMRTGLHAEMPCNCSEESPILNCGHNLREGGLYRDYFQSPSHHSEAYYRPVACISFNDFTNLTTSISYRFQLTIVTKVKTIHKLTNWVLSSATSNTLIPSLRFCLTIHGDVLEGVFYPLIKYKLMNFQSDFDVTQPIKSNSNDKKTVGLDKKQVANSLIFNTHVSIFVGLVIINEERFQRSWGNNTAILKRLIIDESMCLRTAGASTVITMIQLSQDSFIYNRTFILVRELVSYIDIILIGKDNFNKSLPCSNMNIDTDYMTIQKDTHHINTVYNESVFTKNMTNIIPTSMIFVPIVYINDGDEHDSIATVISINRINKVLDISTMKVGISSL